MNQGTSTSGDIVAVRVAQDGTVLDPPTRSFLEGTYYIRANVRLAFADGVFLMPFTDESINGTYDTKAVRFDSNLNLLDTNPIALLATPLSDLAANSTGFYIAWHRQNPDFSAVVAGTRVNTLGQRLDGSGVNISGTKQPYGYATTAVTWDGVGHVAHEGYLK